VLASKQHSTEEQTMKTIREYSIEVYGLDMPSYFPGAGLAFTKYDDIATGIGDSEQEAAEDALEQLAQGDWDTESNAELLAEVKTLDDTDEVVAAEDEFKAANDGAGYDEFDETPSVYVSIRVK
jgi:hypothetical protein